MIESTGQLWEPISYNSGKELTERLWVQGRGWIYRTLAYSHTGDVAVAMCFVPSNE